MATTAHRLTNQIIPARRSEATAFRDDASGHRVFAEGEVAHTTPAASVDQSDEYLGVKTHRIDEHLTYAKVSHPRFESWLREHVRDNKGGFAIKRELLYAQALDRYQGLFGINNRRIEFTHGSQVRRNLRKVLADCPYIEQVSRYQRGRKCDQFRFRPEVLGDVDYNPHHPSGEAKKAPTVKYGEGWMWWPRQGCYIDVPGDWVQHRADAWAELCDLNGWTRTHDYQGVGLNRHVFRSMASIEVPSRVRLERPMGVSGEDWLTKLPWHQQYLGNLQTKSHLLFVSRVRGRDYVFVTGCPRTIRKHLRIAGHPMSEVDVGAAYWTWLAASLRPSKERTMVVDLIKRDQFYETIAEDANMFFEQRSELKAEVQRQCLFWRDPRPTVSPLRAKGMRRFPGLRQRILDIRGKGGVSALSDYLTGRESVVMRAAQRELAANDKEYIPLHDGLLVTGADATMAKEVLERAGNRELGFQPLVRQKTG